MMSAVRKIITDIGEFDPTPELNAVLDEVRLRKDRQPDLRTMAGKKWRQLFKAFSDAKMKEYLADV